MLDGMYVRVREKIAEKKKYKTSGILKFILSGVYKVKVEGEYVFKYCSIRNVQRIWEMMKERKEDYIRARLANGLS